MLEAEVRRTCSDLCLFLPSLRQEYRHLVRSQAQVLVEPRWLLAALRVQQEEELVGLVK